MDEVARAACWDGDDFPYLRLYGPPAKELFENLVRGLCDLRHEGGTAWSLLPHPKAWQMGDTLADYFTETVRCRSRVQGRLSPLEVWKELRRSAAKQRLALGRVPPEVSASLPTPLRLREAVYLSCPGACTNFRPSMAKCVLDLVRRHVARDDLQVLDPCSGWGDRLIGALAAGVASYVGVDPNPMLVQGYAELLRELMAHAPRRVDVRMINEPFEAVDLGAAVFDVVFTSPPFGGRERYWAPGSRGQAEFLPAPNWFEAWMAPALRKMYAHLAPDGLLALYLQDGAACPGLVAQCQDVLLALGARLVYRVSCGRVHRKPLWIFQASARHATPSAR
jgi:16S rRNA G966 N2-methylase RsmD